MREEINGMVFINGILCDGSGRPITERNGYSSEDEEAAIAAYNEAKKNCVVSYSKNYNKPKKKSPQAKTSKNLFTESIVKNSHWKTKLYMRSLLKATL